MNYVPFAEGIVELVVDLYRGTAKNPAVINEHVFQHILKVSWCKITGLQSGQMV